MMKKSIYLLLLPVFLFACKSNKTQPEKDSVTAAPKTHSTKALIAEFKPIIQGVWVKSDYVDKVIATKSPLAAADLATGLTAMNISTGKIAGDSIIAEGGWSNHEGGDLILKFKPGKKKSTIQLGPGDLGYSIQNGDTILTTYWPDDNKNIIATRYRKVAIKSAEGFAQGTFQTINKGLIAGSYSFKDTTGTTSTVIFRTNGTLSGFFAFKQYHVNIDLNSDVMDNLDEISFDYKASTSYSFKFIGDTLKLYDTRPNEDSTLLVLDKLRYTLVKQK
ncbi:hypothetical protein [Mucilaginibacter psychrotolerans]|uniref:Lipocalin-like domain-containing protein n=1 Tax=Mucilaginibacter psychrotolerans TaxID=1524096 RepID=A0A4Y8SHY0_9SPHI|nr:hypothetical protein [Mucilaginibacter psychrotolerans]TFF38006.1 hypothetical protein E2R66_10505 [Mucilaginibacter psychrotolerans]